MASRTKTSPFSLFLVQRVTTSRLEPLLSRYCITPVQQENDEYGQQENDEYGQILAGTGFGVAKIWLIWTRNFVYNTTSFYYFSTLHEYLDNFVSSPILTVAFHSLTLERYHLHPTSDQTYGTEGDFFVLVS